MNAENRSKWQIRLATVSIFLLGFLAGAFALNAYYLWFSGLKPASRQEKFQDIFNGLDMNDSQKTDVQKVIGETKDKIQKLRQESDPRFQEIRDQSDEQLQKILTPDQWQKFQQERDKMHQNEKNDAPPKPMNLK